MFQRGMKGAENGFEIGRKQKILVTEEDEVVDDDFLVADLPP